jgi:hypothetical protein
MYAHAACIPWFLTCSAAIIFWVMEEQPSETVLPQTRDAKMQTTSKTVAYGSG